MINNIALFGDSIFDNEPYVAEGETLIDIFNQNKSAARLFAVDGDTTKGMSLQIIQYQSDPTEYSHFALSIIGNDLLNELHLLGLSALPSKFDLYIQKLTGSIEALLKLGQGEIPLMVFLPYNTLLENSGFEGLYELLNLFKSKVQAEFKNKFDSELRNGILEVVDLETHWDDGFYANPIEPNVQGSQLIYDLIIEWA